MRDLERRLLLGLAGPLPGAAAQLRMAPRPRRGWRPGEWPRDSRHGGGLLLLYPRQGEPHLPLTVRDAGLPRHAGQVSLPGGAAKPEESYAQAALREAAEEVGLDPARVRLLGALSPLYVPVSGFVIHPCVAIAEERPSFVCDPREVAQVLEVPLAVLQESARQRVERREPGNVEIPYFEIAGPKVWGATAMILAELLCVLETPPIPRFG